MSISDYVVPATEVGGPLVLLGLILRQGPRAVLWLVDGTVAIVTKDRDRRESCHTVLDALAHRGRECRCDRP